MYRLVVLSILVSASLARAELRSDELLLIYNRNSVESRALAEYYAEQRNVPEANRVGLDLPLEEDLRRTDYETRMVAPIRRHLWDKRLATKVRCLVTFYDVPLRVGVRELTEIEAERSEWADKEWDKLGAEIERNINLAHILAEGASGERALEIARIPRRDKGVSELRKAYVRYRRRLSARLMHSSDAAEAGAARMKFLDVVLVLDGLAGADRTVSLDPDLFDDDVAARLRGLKKEPTPKQERINRLLSSGILGAKYPKGIELLARRNGLTEAYRRLGDDRRRLNFKNTIAAVDSELALLWWKPYRLGMMIANWLVADARKKVFDIDGIGREYYSQPVLMTARLDAPSPEIVRRMIDDSIAVEKVGLRGTFYVDRDPSRRSGSLAMMETGMDEAAWLIRNYPTDSISVVVDNSKDLFQAGTCPDTALYVGWYGLMNYVDAFDFVPGAVGYHVASGEAVSLRDPTKLFWCKEMLKDGAAATIGAVREPYLRAMTRPEPFFGVLLTGQFTLAETFALSNRYVSWMVILIGDPLYTPFKTNPILTMDAALPADLLPVDQGMNHFTPVPEPPKDANDTD